MRWPLFVLPLGLAACGSCRGNDSGDRKEADAAPSPSAAPSVVPEALPRCRAEPQKLAIPGEDIVVGDVAVGAGGLLVGLVRANGGKRVASVLRAPLDLSSSQVVDVGTAFGDDPPPSPRWDGEKAVIAHLLRGGGDGGVRTRILAVEHLRDQNLVGDARIEQQADESTAFDLAFGEGGGLAAWDEDAPKNDRVDGGMNERGFIKVQLLGTANGEKAHVVSPDTSDAESPRLITNGKGGFWLAWMAQHLEEEAFAIEGPGERRAFRWVEVVPLDGHGAPVGPVRRVGSEKGRAVSFELARSSGDLVVLVQDEAAGSEGSGSRIVRHRVAEHVEAAEVVDAGVGHASAELVPIAEPNDAGTRWLAWSDVAEHAHLTSLTAGSLTGNGASTAEPSLDGARLLAASAPDAVYALIGAVPSETRETGARPHPELRRFSCR